jgi:hypothetical protein
MEREIGSLLEPLHLTNRDAESFGRLVLRPAAFATDLGDPAPDGLDDSIRRFAFGHSATVAVDGLE